MIVIVDRIDEPLIKEKIGNSSASFKRVDLYNRTVYVIWGDNIKINNKNMIVSKNGLALSLREWKNEKTEVMVGDVKIGGNDIVVAAGPCSVESEEQMFEAARIVKKYGGSILRGGIYKPRTSPYSFQGLGDLGMNILLKVRDDFSMPVVTEFLEKESAKKYQNFVDMIQVGSRNAQNFPFLGYLGTLKKPVLLKNGMGNSVTEWLSSSEYVLSNGNGDVVLCYRGVKSSIPETRFNFDLGAIAKVKEMTHLPLCIDPSHPSGNRKFVETIALAGIAAGADMLEIEVHPDPENALSDSEQQLNENEFRNLMENVKRLAEALGRRVWNLR